MNLHSYDIDKRYEKSVAYFSMEFAICLLYTSPSPRDS